MVQIVIAALAKGMAVANLTLEESLTLLNTTLRPFLGENILIRIHPLTIHTERQRCYGKQEIPKRPSCSRSIVQQESDTLYELQNQVAFHGGPVCRDSKVLGLSAG